MRKIILSVFSCVCLLLAVALFAPGTEARTPCEETVTYQHDDLMFCDPAGNTCVVVWGCPDK